MNRYHWSYQNVDAHHIAQLSTSLNVGTHWAECLYKRGIGSFDEAKTFFCPSETHLHDPFLMKDMDRALDRIALALERKESLLIYGDYDVDGTTSSVVLFLGLADLLGYPKENIDIYIPDRIKEGYGVHAFGVRYILEKKPSLVVMVDCGISAVDHIEMLVSQGVDCIICDHHLTGKKLPPALAILNPKQPNCAYPYKELSACGIVYKLLQALALRYSISPKKCHPYLDLVALSSAADIVPLTGENRTLMALGLEQLNQHARPSIAQLATFCGIKEFDVENIVFGIAPRINAAGRIEHAKKAVELMLSEDEETLALFSKHLNTLNTERKEIQKNVFEEARMQYAEKKEAFPFAAVLCHQAWFKGVLGIVASKVTETFGKPAIVFTEDESYLVGSGRSIEGLDLYETLAQCSAHIETFGGHRAAAGLKIKKEKILHFEKAFHEAVCQAFGGHIPQPKLEIDAELRLSGITPNMLSILKRMQPFGPSNRNPLWVAKGVELLETPVLLKEKHLKALWRQNGTTYTGILFNFGDTYFPSLVKGKAYDIAFKIKQDQWNGTTRTSLVLEDIATA